MQRNAAQIRDDLEELIRTAQALETAKAEERSAELKKQQLASLEHQLDNAKKILAGAVPPPKKTVGQRIKAYLQF